MSNVSTSTGTNTAFISSALKPLGTLNLRDGLRSSFFESPRPLTKLPLQCANTLPVSAFAFQVATFPALIDLGSITAPLPEAIAFATAIDLTLASDAVFAFAAAFTVAVTLLTSVLWFVSVTLYHIVYCPTSLTFGTAAFHPSILVGFESR